MCFYELYDDIPSEGRMTWSDIDLTDPWDSTTKQKMTKILWYQLYLIH